MVLPLKASSKSGAHMASLQILKVLEFNAQTLKSGVVAHDSRERAGVGLLFVRGAAGVIESCTAFLPPY